MKAIVAIAEKRESEFAKLKYTKTPGKRGFGGVLTTGKVPRKVLARHEKTYITDERGDPKREMKLSIPYFVFEDDGERVFVGRVQDRDIAVGWIAKKQLYPWPSRRPAYPNESGDIASLLLGPDSGVGIPRFDPQKCCLGPFCIPTEMGKQ